MRLRYQIKALAALAIALGLWACKPADEEPADSDGKLRVIVSVAPQADFVRRIGGEHVKVDVLVGDGQDPHSFSPDPAQMKAVTRAQLYLTVGMPFEEALAGNIANSGSGIKVVSMAEGFEKIPSQCDHPSHSEDGEEFHEDLDEHEHGEDDPHVWLGPTLVKVQAKNIADALTEALPEHRAQFEDNLTAFCAELDTLHAELQAQLKPHIGEEFFVFHPAFGYFGYTYGIDQVAVEVGGNNPTPKELAEFIAHAKEKNMKVLFVQPQFDDRSAKVIAEQLGARVEALDPLAPDVLSNLRTIGKAIAAGFTE